jgi:hypothetical protein
MEKGTKEMKLPCIKVERFQDPDHKREFVRVLEDSDLFGYKIPANFVCDGASVPRIFWFILSPFREGIYAAIVHDHMLRRETTVTRKQADTIFYRNLRQTGIGLIRSWLAYLAVRLWSTIYTKLPIRPQCLS